jgi:hypothetical protein
MSAASSEMTARVNAELARLSSTLNFAAPSSMLYDPNNFVSRPPCGIRLSNNSNMQTIEARGHFSARDAILKNQLGNAITETTWGTSRRDILKKGVLEADEVLSVRPDAEQAALDARLAAKPFDPEMAGTMAHEIMKRDTVRGAREPKRGAGARRPPAHRPPPPYRRHAPRRGRAEDKLDLPRAISAVP